MIFTLEALQAKHGDSLLLHYGEPDDLQLILIDGGPSGVYDISLRPRLEELKNQRTGNAPLQIRMAMVSHIDDDHINGMLELFEQLSEEGANSLCNIVTLWHNSFDDILGNKEVSAISSALPEVKLSSTGGVDFPPGLFSDEPPAAIAASVSQGKRLRDKTDGLTLLNDGFEGLVCMRTDNKDPINIDDLLDITILGPSQMRLEKLEKDWDEKLPKIKSKPPAEAKALAAELIDKSVYNLSSIVVLVEALGKKMLLTGDGLSKDILESLKETGHLKDGETFHVDLLKMPHHGSIRNINKEFLEKVTADHYVMSADGRHDNPDVATLKLISEVRGDAEYTVHLTNTVKDPDEFYAEDMQKPGKNYELNVRKDPDLSLRIHFGEPFND